MDLGSYVDPAWNWVPGSFLGSKGGWYNIDPIAYQMPIDL